jgi:hypothetical protein
MKIRIAYSILVLILVSCTASRTEAPTQGLDLEDMDPETAIAYLAEDINIGDGGLLSSQPCSSPCAFGIRIGETQLDQVIPVLENNGVSRCWTEPNLSWSLISCGGNRFHVQVDMHTSLVNAIGFDPSVPIALGDVIEKYGEPNYVTVDQDATRNLQLRLYWNSIRMLVAVPEILGETYDVKNTTEVEGISFSDENLYRISDKETNPYYQPWNGYGTYQPTEPFPLNPTPIATATP